MRQVSSVSSTQLGGRGSGGAQVCPAARLSRVGERTRGGEAGSRDLDGGRGRGGEDERVRAGGGRPPSRSLQSLASDPTAHVDPGLLTETFCSTDVSVQGGGGGLSLGFCPTFLGWRNIVLIFRGNNKAIFGSLGTKQIQWQLKPQRPVLGRPRELCVGRLPPPGRGFVYTTGGGGVCRRRREAGRARCGAAAPRPHRGRP